MLVITRPGKRARWTNLQIENLRFAYSPVYFDVHICMDPPVPDSQLLISAAERSQQSTERKALQRLDWLRRALDLFVAEGIDAVRITRLADDLQVTRGSFYWHFDNREDLIGALVDFWQRKNTPAFTRAVRDADSLEQGIFNVFELCIDSERFDPRLDLALREWARRSPGIRARVDGADAERIDALRDFFARYDYAATDALIRARVLYFSQIGFYALEVHEPLEQRLAYTEAYFESFTGRRPDPRRCRAFVEYISKHYGEQTP